MTELFQFALSLVLIFCGENMVVTYNPSFHKLRMLVAGLLSFYAGWAGIMCAIASLGVAR